MAVSYEHHNEYSTVQKVGISYVTERLIAYKGVSGCMGLLSIRTHAGAHLIQIVGSVLYLRQVFFKLEILCPPLKLPRCLK